jgi:hypothetical protein
LRHGGVANPRDTCGYRCGLRLALTQNPSFLFVPPSRQHCTRRPCVRERNSPRLDKQVPEDKLREIDKNWTAAVIGSADDAVRWCAWFSDSVDSLID